MSREWPRSRPPASHQHVLLAALAALLLAYPAMVELEVVRLYRVVFAVVLIAGVRVLGRKRGHLWIALALWLSMLLLQAGAAAVDSALLSLAASLALLLFLSSVGATLLGAVLGRGAVGGGRIAGAISVYLLLGLSWAVLHGLVHELDPAAYRGLAPRPVGAEGGGMAFLYFSFVTLTTLGFGDINPVSATAQTVTWIEAVTGQLYLAILIARLVGLHVAHQDLAGRDDAGAPRWK